MLLVVRLFARVAVYTGIVIESNEIASRMKDDVVM